MKYVQCIMEKGNLQQTSWVPEKFAKMDKFLRLKDDDGWKVISVGAKSEKKYVEDRSQDYKKTRKASDI